MFFQKPGMFSFWLLLFFCGPNLGGIRFFNVMEKILPCIYNNIHLPTHAERVLEMKFIVDANDAALGQRAPAAPGCPEFSPVPLLSINSCWGVGATLIRYFPATSRETGKAVTNISSLQREVVLPSEVGDSPATGKGSHLGRPKTVTNIILTLEDEDYALTFFMCPSQYNVL